MDYREGFGAAAARYEDYDYYLNVERRESDDDYDEYQERLVFLGV